MPVVGFNSVEEHSKEKIENLYGRKIKGFRIRKVIDSETLIPYVCDFTQKQFKIAWKSLRCRINSKHHITKSKEIYSNGNLIKDIIQKYGQNKTITSVAKYYNCGRSTIEKILIMNKIEIKKMKHPKSYSKEEIEFLINNYSTHTIEYCANFLNRSIHSIKHMSIILNLEKIKTKNTENIIKTCNFCKTILTANNSFYYNNNPKLICHRCNKERCSLRRMKSSKDDLRKFRLLTLLSSSKRRAKEKKFEFNLDFEWLDKNTPELCPIFKTKLIFSILQINKKRIGANLFAPSIDRVDNSKGYTKENCIIVSFKANTIKNMATIDELCQVADFYKNLRSQNVTCIS